MNIREELFKLKDDNYKKFNNKLINSNYLSIGVRLPFIKKLAKEISKENNDSYFENIEDPYFEEVMLEGLVIGYYKDIDLVISKLKRFVKKIDSWSINDSCCCNLKIVLKNKDKMWEYITTYKDSEEEFEVRFMLIMMMSYYLDDEYILKIFEIIDNLKCDKYYVKMAVAWLLATAVYKKESATLEYLKHCKLDKFTFNKVISKCKESYRVRDEIKVFLKGLLLDMKK